MRQLRASSACAPMHAALTLPCTGDARRQAGMPAAALSAQRAHAHPLPPAGRPVWDHLNLSSQSRQARTRASACKQALLQPLHSDHGTHVRACARGRLHGEARLHRPRHAEVALRPAPPELLEALRQLHLCRVRKARQQGESDGRSVSSLAQARYHSVYAGTAAPVRRAHRSLDRRLLCMHARECRTAGLLAVPRRARPHRTPMQRSPLGEGPGARRGLARAAQGCRARAAQPARGGPGRARGCRGPMDSAMSVYAKLCQSMMKAARCQQHASQHSGSVGMAGGTCRAARAG